MSYIFDTSVEIHMPKKAKHAVISELLSNYAFGAAPRVLFDSDDNVIFAGTPPVCPSQDSTTICADNNGLLINGTDFPSVMHGFTTFLESLKHSEDGRTYIDPCEIVLSPKLRFRCVHLCIFPETELDFLKKCVRSCALAGYTHIIFEFWGMLKFECMKELSWPFAFEKDEIRKIVCEANALGLEIIPMFNHLGHASSCREINGKHVVLDQNPKYEYMFTSYGWVWNYRREDVYALLRSIREELIEVCGNGKYFHLGCDEAYGIGCDEAAAKSAAEYINKVSAELSACGRRGIIWGDMLLSRDEFGDYELNSSRKVSDILTSHLDKRLIVADWQYAPHGENWKTSKRFSEHGFDVLCCPWQGTPNIDEAISTACQNGLLGIIQTTWHTLYQETFRSMIYAGAASSGRSCGFDDYRFYCAHIARKASSSHGEFEKCGWSPKMTGPGL